MRQALHIFKKDALNLVPEIALVLLVTAFIPYLERHQANLTPPPAVILPIAWFVLVSRAIHSEALPGDKQFWRTRPYSRASLCGAKALFLIAFLSVPMAICQALVLESHGFDASDFWPGLIFEQILLFAAIAAPAAAIATVTAGTKSFVLATLAAIIFALATVSRPGEPTSWGILEWLHDSILVGFMGVAGLAIAAWQYARQRTWPARIGAAVLVLAGGFIGALPASAGWSIAPRLAPNWWAGSWITVALDRSQSHAPLPEYLEYRRFAEADLPLHVIGLPRGVTPRPDELHIANFPVNATWHVDSQGNVHQIIVTNPQNFQLLKDQVIDLEISGVVTLTRNRRVTPVLENADRLSLPGGAICKGRPLRCEAPLRAPEFAVFLGTGRPWVSYSPFPAELLLDPMVNGGGLGANEIATEEPVAHFPIHFVLRDVRLADYEVPPGEER